MSCAVAHFHLMAVIYTGFALEFSPGNSMFLFTWQLVIAYIYISKTMFCSSFLLVFQQLMIYLINNFVLFISYCCAYNMSFYGCLMELGRPLYFCPVVSSSSIFLFSSPDLSRRRLDVCHTSTHGVALVRISNAGLKCAARGSLEMQDSKKSPKIAIWVLLHNFVGLYLRN